MTTYEAGQSWSELPGEPPQSQRQCQRDTAGQSPRQVLAVFVVDTNETELVIPFGN